MNRSPADVVIDELAESGLSIRGLAKRLGVNSSTVSRWRAPVPAGCGGTIPARYHRDLLAIAAELGARLGSDDLIHGRRDGSMAA